ncbi:MAG: hypothetical protein WBG08_07175, partial [Litorimonas sp.]
MPAAPSTPLTLRARLRDGTADSHDRIDRRMGALDLTTVDGLARLLGTHALVQGLFGPVCGPDALDFREELAADLASLG